MSFAIALRHGITGGFAPPVLKEVVEIQGDNSGASIKQHKLDTSTNEFKSQAGGASYEDLSGLLEEIKNQLKELPTEQPVGSQDIYGQDVSISFFTDDFQWANGGEGGCSQGESSVQATPEQKEKFKELVDIVKGLGQQYAVTAQ